MPRVDTCAPWADLEDLLDEVADVDSDVGETCLQWATNTLFAFTGNRWPGVCEATVRPYVCGHEWGCGCGPSSAIDLPLRPVVAVSEVRVNGEVVPQRLYRVDGERWLVFLHEEVLPGDPRGWPRSQRLDRAPTEPSTFSVTFTHGAEPPAGAAMVTASLAGELIKAVTPTSDACRLPKRVQTLTRQGVAIAVLDPLTLFDEGKTGLPEVDLWVSAQNAGKRRRRASVHIPGRAAPRRADRFRRG